MVCLSAPAWGQTDSSGYTPMGSGYTPSSITTTVEYDAESGTYVKVTRLGEMVLGKEYMTFDEYQDWKMDELMQQYWDEKKEGTVEFEDEKLILIDTPGIYSLSTYTIEEKVTRNCTRQDPSTTTLTTPKRWTGRWKAVLMMSA